ncbi:hypothetical protein AMECASPLE_036415 [Ameca splendens]|uniref:Uncharacterized protein n=1 Tax=Ameca splendens TaxID=208324 RepID=A0ABV0XKP6_9TELE
MLVFSKAAVFDLSKLLDDAGLLHDWWSKSVSFCCGGVYSGAAEQKMHLQLWSLQANHVFHRRHCPAGTTADSYKLNVIMFASTPRKLSSFCLSGYDKCLLYL